MIMLHGWTSIRLDHFFFFHSFISNDIGLLQIVKGGPSDLEKKILQKY